MGWTARRGDLRNLGRLGEGLQVGGVARVAAHVGADHGHLAGGRGRVADRDDRHGRGGGGDRAGVAADPGRRLGGPHQKRARRLGHFAPLVTHDLHHGRGIETEDLGITAHGDQGRLLIGEAGEVALLQGLEVEATDAGAVLDRLQAQAQLLAGLLEFRAVVE